MSKPHKFISGVPNPVTNYQAFTVCEYCGFVSWHANRHVDTNAQAMQEAAKGCPLSPATNENKEQS